MILTGLRIVIKDFWPCKISKEFPSNSFKIIDLHPSKSGDSIGLLETDAGGDSVLKYLKSQKEVSKAEVLVDEDYKLISFNFSHGPLGEIIVKTGIHVRPPLFLEKGFIKVNLIGTEKNIQKFIAESKKLENINIELLKKTELQYYDKPKLTQKQEFFIQKAVELGFYDVPRKINIEELAKRLKISPSTLAEHLRKAEGKIVKDFF